MILDYIARYDVLHFKLKYNKIHGHTYYYATFELENGERMELSIPSHQIGYLVEGDNGVLSFQGSLFVKFDRV